MLLLRLLRLQNVALMLNWPRARLLVLRRSLGRNLLRYNRRRMRALVLLSRYLVLHLRRRPVGRDLGRHVYLRRESILGRHRRGHVPRGWQRLLMDLRRLDCRERRPVMAL
jgi:hypothetical protein